MKIHESLIVKGSRKNYDSLKLVPKIQLHLPITLIWWKAFISSEWNESSWMCSPIQNALLYYSPYIHSITHTYITLLHRWTEKLLIIIIIIKLRLALFVTYTIIQSITSSEMCSLHLTHPSAHTWSSEQPTLRRPGSSWGFSALLKGLTSVVDNSCRSRDSGYKSDALSNRTTTAPSLLPDDNVLLQWKWWWVLHTAKVKWCWIAVQMNMLVMKVDAWQDVLTLKAWFRPD